MKYRWLINSTIKIGKEAENGAIIAFWRKYQEETATLPVPNTELIVHSNLSNPPSEVISEVTKETNPTEMAEVLWLDGSVGEALDYQSKGRGFKFHCSRIFRTSTTVDAWRNTFPWYHFMRVILLKLHSSKL